MRNCIKKWIVKNKRKLIEKIAQTKEKCRQKYIHVEYRAHDRQGIENETPDGRVNEVLFTFFEFVCPVAKPGCQEYETNRSNNKRSVVPPIGQTLSNNQPF
jgi:hypothetical protein